GTKRVGDGSAAATSCGRTPPAHHLIPCRPPVSSFPSQVIQPFEIAIRCDAGCVVALSDATLGAISSIDLASLAAVGIGCLCAAASIHCASVGAGRTDAEIKLAASATVGLLDESLGTVMMSARRAV